MKDKIRIAAEKAGLPLMDYILKRVKELNVTTGIPRSMFAACPNSISVLRASLRAAKRNNSPILFAATLNQVDTDGGYTGMTPHQFVKTIQLEARSIGFDGPWVICVDHGGPWLKDTQRVGKYPFDKAMNEIKKSFEACIDAGYDLIHVDPTVDIFLKPGENISIDVVAARTLELIVHTETYRRQKGHPRISYEVGTEEVHGGLADMKVFNRFLTLLKEGLKNNNLTDVWPCFVVGKVGTDLHTSLFDPIVAKELTKEAAPYGSVIKGHYSDNVDNPQDYPTSGMGAANIGPEFTEGEYRGLLELEDIEDELLKQGRIVKKGNMKAVLWNAVIRSARWQKWLQKGEDENNFYSISPERQEWLIQTGCRYIWEDTDVIAARKKLYDNCYNNGIDADTIVMMNIERQMDKYFEKFNIVNLNNLL